MVRLDVLATELAEDRFEVEPTALTREAVNALRVPRKGRAALKSLVVPVAARAFLRATQLRQLPAFGGIGVAVALASVSLGLPLVIGGLGHVALGLYLLLAMPETGFRRAAPGDRDTWSAMAETLRAGLGLIARQRVLVALFGAAFFMGAFSETFDRLWEAHLLADFESPTGVDCHRSSGSASSTPQPCCSRRR